MDERFSQKRIIAQPIKDISKKKESKNLKIFYYILILVGLKLIST